MKNIKTQLFIAGLCLAVAQPLYAQWTQNGSDIYYNNGKVGIGTTTPGKKLHIQGGGIIINDNTAPAITIKGWTNFGVTNGGDYPYWGMNVRQNSVGEWDSYHSSLRGSLILNFGNHISFASTNSSTTAASLTHHMRINTTNGRVGIGTTIPDRNLTVLGVGNSYLNLKTDNGYEFLIGANTNGGIISTMSNHDLQIRAGGNSTKMIVKADGNVGIGTTDPQYGLDITKRLLRVKGSIPGLLLEDTNDPGNPWMLFAGSPSLGDFKIRYQGNDTFVIKSNGKVGIGTTTPSYELQVNGRIGIGGNQIRFSENRGLDYDIAQNALFYNDFNNGQVVKLGDIGGNAWFLGNVGIGTTVPDAKLTVKGDIHTREVKVDLNGAVAPDFVFEPDYNLRTLAETEAYIKENKHLPEIPSAAEMEQNGLELKTMNLKLLQKVEELTLYVIDLQKQVNTLKQQTKN